MAPDLVASLQRLFGFREFRGVQRAVIEHHLASGSALVLMATGEGKSLCYQLPAFVGEGLTVVVSPPAPNRLLRGYHLRRQGQRLDHMAYKYLQDPAGFWRICELNDVMQAEMLSEADEIAILVR